MCEESTYASHDGALRLHPLARSQPTKTRHTHDTVDVRRRVQLIQDFEMPDVSHTVNVSRDGRYVFATGSYKSWLKCYDLENLSLKFQRGLDAAVIKMIPLSDDYSKASTAAVILQDDRFKKLFADEDFEVDQDCELFKRNVAVQKKESLGKVKEIMYDDQEDKDDEIIEQSELPDIDDMNETTSKRIRSAASSSSDDDSETDEETLPEKKRREREKARRKLERRERQKQLYEEKTLEREAERTARLINKPKKFVLHELDSTEGARRFLDEHVKEAAVEEESSSLASKKSLMQQQGDFEEHEDVFGERSITFNLKKRGASAREAKAIEERKKHRKERRETVRTPTTNIKRSLKRLPGNLSRP
ncbi:NUC153 domain protein [Teladorsagia circumcincta]|uniref:NUC153 domain protein n=1 Tax=Teladorsagia circumcincta TaxID=45464 RepID=A0A2G9TW45_TELCI|nr:NUC153 domain protein [Teladorsagia circumcincta]